MTRTATIRRPSSACRWPTTSERGSRSFSTTRPIARPACHGSKPVQLGLIVAIRQGTAMAMDQESVALSGTTKASGKGENCSNERETHCGGMDSRKRRRGSTCRGCWIMFCFTASGIPKKWAWPRCGRSWRTGGFRAGRRRNAWKRRPPSGFCTRWFWNGIGRVARWKESSKVTRLAREESRSRCI